MPFTIILHRILGRPWATGALILLGITEVAILLIFAPYLGFLLNHIISALWGMLVMIVIITATITPLDAEEAQLEYGHPYEPGTEPPTENFTETTFTKDESRNYPPPW